MNIPILEKSKRSREYEDYSKEQHKAVVEAYLFQGLSHRKIEKFAMNSVEKIISKCITL